MSLSISLDGISLDFIMLITSDISIQLLFLHDKASFQVCEPDLPKLFLADFLGVMMGVGREEGR